MTFAGTFQIPTYAISYIKYGDASGLDDLDVELIDGFIDSNFPKGFVVDWHGIDAPYFSSNPEFGLPMDVVDADSYYCQNIHYGKLYAFLFPYSFLRCSNSGL